MGFKALSIKNTKVFDVPEIMPKLISNLSDEQYEERWHNITSKMQKGDAIFTFNSKSFISKFIAKLDKGSWSHVSQYIGNNEIREAISSGFVKRNIEVYKQKYIHIGVYRYLGITSEVQEKIAEFTSKFIGYKYDYFGAISLGIRTILGLTEDSYNPKDVTPNGLIYIGNLYLVDYL